MRIAYVCYWNAFRPAGVATKISMQVGAWRELGHDAVVFCLSPAGPPGARAHLPARLFAFDGPAARVRATARLIRAVRTFAPDVVYVRDDSFVPPPVRLLRDVPSAMELNSDNRREMALAPLPQRLYGRVNDRLLRGAVSGFVAVSHELARGVAPLGKPVTVVSNGVRLEDWPEPRPPAPGPPTLVFLAGADLPWHGIDKVLDLAARLPEFRFVLVGVDVPRWSTDAPENAVLHGPLPRERYDDLVAAADVGIAALGFHRKGAGEVSTLKVPEYLAYGLPVILGYEETDLVGIDPWYVLRLANTESNVRDGVDSVRAFVERVRGRRVAHAEVAPLIDARLKERARLDFLSSLR